MNSPYMVVMATSMCCPIPGPPRARWKIQTGGAKWLLLWSFCLKAFTCVYMLLDHIHNP